MTRNKSSSNSNGIRRRRDKSKNEEISKVEDSEVNALSTTKETGRSSEETLASSSFWNDRLNDVKPILLITACVVLPYGLYNLYYYVLLQRPEWLAWIFPDIRPAVKLDDPRKVLIVGTMSSGTTQLAHDLASRLGLEIGHENSETSWSFVRDGTVSWFHGIRFLPRPGIDDKDISLVIPIPEEYQKTFGPDRQTSITVEGDTLFKYSIARLCREMYPNMGFHPFMFRDNRKCSFRHSWDSCWKEECKGLLKEEWGCALLPSSSSTRSCTTPYHKTLHQTRHPLRTVASLVTKFCIGGVAGEVQPSFVTFASALFPKHDFSELSCIEAAGYYVYEYTTAMLKAALHGSINGRFSVEDATPCSVAEMAGFWGSNNTTDELPHERRIRENIQKLCGIYDDELIGIKSNLERGNGDNNSEQKKTTIANRPMVSTKNTYNQGQLSLDWDDLLGGRHGSQKKPGDRDLQQRLKRLTQKELQYD